MCEVYGFESVTSSFTKMDGERCSLEDFTEVYWWYAFAIWYSLDLREGGEHHSNASREMTTWTTWFVQTWPPCRIKVLRHGLISYFTMPLSVSFERVWMMFSLQFKVDILATFQRLRAECLAVYAEIAMVVALTRILGSGTSRSQEDESTLSQVATDEWKKWGPSQSWASYKVGPKSSVISRVNMGELTPLIEVK